MAWNFWKKENAIPEKKSMALGMSESLGSFMMIGEKCGARTPAAALSLYRQSSAVSVPINRIATAIQGMDLVVISKDGVSSSDHPVLDLLKTPSPFFSKNLFLETIVKNFLITGEMAVVAIGGIMRPPLELQPISPDKISVAGKNGGVGSFLITGENMTGQYVAIRNGTKVRYLRDELTEIQFTRNFRTQNNSMLRGESLLVSASKEIRQHILGGEHNISLLEKGGRVSLVFHFEQDMDDDEFQLAKERVRAQYGGAGSAGEIGVTAGEGGFSVNEFGTNNRDMDFAVLQRMAKIAVANQYGFPLVLLDNEKSTFNNYGVAKEALYDDAAVPVANFIMAGLTDLLMPRYGEDPSNLRIGVDLDSISALQSRRNKELLLRKQIGIETINELREAIPNRENVEGGDEVLIPANLVPLDYSNNFESNPSAFPKNDEE